MGTLSATNAPFAISYDTELLVPETETQDTLSTPIHTATQNREIQKNYMNDWLGQGFTYTGADSHGLWYPDTGTVTGFAVLSMAGDTLIALSGISVSVNSLNNISPPSSPTAPTENIQMNMLLFAGDDALQASRFNDKLAGFGGSDQLDGAEGIDTAVYFSTRSSYSIIRGSADWKVSGGGDGADTLTNIERLQFSDTKVALDVSDNALETMQFLGVIAPSLQSNLNVRGTILSLFDQGKSMQEMSQLALDLGLITSDNTALAKTVFKNVFNTTADPDLGLTNTLVSFIEQNGAAKFLATVAGMSINVDLVGLQQHGMEFL